MNNLDTGKDEILELIAKNKLADAVKKIIIYTKEFAYEELSNALLISNSFNELRIKKMNGTIRIDEEEVLRNKLILKAIQVVNDVSVKGNYSSVNKKQIGENDLKSKLIEKRIIFDIKGLSKNHSDDFELFVNSCFIRESDFVSIFGFNGSGKTTFLRTLAGELYPDKGKVRYNESTATRNYKVLNNDVVFVPQERRFFYGDLYENLLFLCYSNNYDETEALLRVDYVINRFSLSNHIHKEWEQLSTGYRLRYMLAESLVIPSKVIILDEPLANLDYLSKIEILSDLKEFCESKSEPRTVIISSQEVDIINDYISKAIYLVDGKVVYDGDITSISLFYHSKLVEVSFVNEIDEIAVKTIFNDQLKDVRKNSGRILLYFTPNILDESIIKNLVENKLWFHSYKNISNSIQRFYL